MAVLDGSDTPSLYPRSRQTDQNTNQFVNQSANQFDQSAPPCATQSAAARWPPPSEHQDATFEPWNPLMHGAHFKDEEENIDEYDTHYENAPNSLHLNSPVRNSQPPPAPQLAVAPTPFQSVVAPPPLQSATPNPGSLRYHVTQFVPPEEYFDCDLFYLFADAGTGPGRSNCFGCGRAKTICPGFPNCPPNINCVFCGKPWGQHANKNNVSYLPNSHHLTSS